MLIVSAESVALDRYELRIADTDSEPVARARAARVASLLAQIGHRDTWAGGRVTVHQRDGDRLVLVARVAVVHAVASRAAVPVVADPCGFAAVIEPQPQPVEAAPMFEVFTQLQVLHHKSKKVWKWSVELRPVGKISPDLTHQRSGLEKCQTDAQLSMAVAVRQMETQAKALGFKFPEE